MALASRHEPQHGRYSLRMSEIARGRRLRSLEAKPEEAAISTPFNELRSKT